MKKILVHDDRLEACETEHNRPSFAVVITWYKTPRWTAKQHLCHTKQSNTHPVSSGALGVGVGEEGRGRRGTFGRGFAESNVLGKKYQRRIVLVPVFAAMLLVRRFHWKIEGRWLLEQFWGCDFKILLDDFFLQFLPRACCLFPHFSWSLVDIVISILTLPAA